MCVTLRQRSSIHLISYCQTLKEAHGQTAWLETCARTVGNDGMRGVPRPYCLVVHSSEDRVRIRTFDQDLRPVPARKASLSSFKARVQWSVRV